MADFLDTFDWDFFATFTSHHELTLPSARRAMEGLHRKLNVVTGSTPVNEADRTRMFWVAEPFDCKEGFHTHALVKCGLGVNFENIKKTWEVVCGAKKLGTKARAQLRRYVPANGANYYVGKYIQKRLCDYDFL